MSNNNKHVSNNIEGKLALFHEDNIFVTSASLIYGLVRYVFMLQKYKESFARNQSASQ